MSDLQPLRDWLVRWPPDDAEATRFQPGETIVRADGSWVNTLGDYRYSDAFDGLWKALEAAGRTNEGTQDYHAVVDRWNQRHGVDSLCARHVPLMDRYTLFNALRFYQRGERFCDGLWATAWRSGFLHAGARALIAMG